MSKIDEKYINALDNFTDALEQIVDTLKEQQKTGKADVVNEMLKNTPIDSIHKVVVELKKTTKKGFADIKSDNQTIIKEIKSLKNQKESGSFDKIEDPKNKNKIVDGIKVVMLIAGGVLALGMAFKIIGKVDFLSVIALSTSIFMMATAFSKIVALENLSFKNVLIAASTIPLMALGLAISGYILSGFPTLTIAQGISMLLVAGTLGIASYLLLTALSKLDSKSFVMIPLLPLMLPLIALGIVASSHILKYTQELTLRQVFSAALVGLAIGVAMIGITLALKAMKGVSWKEMLMLPLMVPLIAGGIVAASWIFKLLAPIENPIQLLISSAVIGLSLLMFVPAVYILGKMKTDDLIRGSIAVVFLAGVMTLSSILLQYFVPVNDPLALGLSALAMGISVLFFVPAVWLLGKMNISQIVKGTVGVLAVSAAILGTAWLFSFLPDNMKYPSWQWSLYTGLTILGFGLVAVIVGLFTMVPTFWMGLLGIVALAAAILATDFIISKGDFKKYPSMDWIKGVGLSIGGFGLAALLLGGLILTGIGAAALLAGVVGILGLAAAMLAVDKILSAGSFTKYPSLDWANGVSASMAIFTGLQDGKDGKNGFMSTIGKVGKGLVKGVGGSIVGKTMIPIAEAMVKVDKILSGSSFTKYPSEKWAEGVSASMAVFTGLKGGKDESIWGAAKGALKGVIKGVGGSIVGKTMVPIAEAMVEIDKIFNKGKFDKYPNKEFVDGVVYLNSNIVDSVKNFGKIDLDDFLEFSVGVGALIPTLQMLSTLKPLPSNVLNGYTNFIDKLDGFPELSEIDTRTQSITNLANAFLILANSLTEVNSNLDGFTNLSKGLYLISIIDDTKLDNILESVDKHKSTLSVINQVPEEENNLFSVIKGLYQNTSQTPEKETVSTVDDSFDIQQKQFYQDVSEIRNLLYEFRDHIDKPSQAGSFNSF